MCAALLLVLGADHLSDFNPLFSSFLEQCDQRLVLRVSPAAGHSAGLLFVVLFLLEVGLKRASPLIVLGLDVDALLPQFLPSFLPLVLRFVWFLVPRLPLEAVFGQLALGDQFLDRLDLPLGLQSGPQFDPLINHALPDLKSGLLAHAVVVVPFDSSRAERQYDRRVLSVFFLDDQELGLVGASAVGTPRPTPIRRVIRSWLSRVAVLVLKKLLGYVQVL